jgi:hypothetical protein
MPKKKSVPLPAESEIRESAISILGKVHEPNTAKQICGVLKFACKIPEAVLVPLLEASIDEGQLHQFAPATAKGKPRYWDRDVIEWGKVQIEQLLQKKEPQTAAKLKTAAKGLNEAQFKQAFHGLVEVGRLREHPPIGKSKTLKYGTEPPACQPYLTDLGKTLTKVVKQLTDAGVDRATLSSAVEALITDSGLSLSPQIAKPDVATIPPSGELDLLMLMRQIEPGADRGALVTSRELRRASTFDKQQFDQIILHLARQGKLMLHRHDYASGLSSLERDELVTDGAGNYYVGMALRRTEG